jgi:hypothetical protein
MKKVISFAFIIFTLPVFPQQWNWAAKANSTTGKQTAVKICADNTGNVIVLGKNDGKATYGSTLLDSGSFIVRYFPNGNLSWARKIEGQPLDITCDNAGDIYVTGTFSGNINISPYNFSSAGGDDIFVTKISSLGNTVWVKQFGNGNDEKSNALAIDNNFNCYFTGHYKDSIFFDTKFLKDSTGFKYFNDIFLTKLDPAGNVAWATSGPNNYSAANLYYYNGTCVRISKDQNACLIGIGNTIYGSYPDIVFMKYTASGGLLSNKQPWNCFSALDFAIDDSTSLFHINNSSTHYMYTPDLQFFDQQINYRSQIVLSDGGYYPNFLLDRGLCSDDTGNVFLSGFLGGTYMSGNTCTVYTTPMTRKGGTDIMLGKFDNTGNCKWLKTAGGINDESASTMCIDPVGNCYVLGQYNLSGKSAFSDTINFDNHKLTNDGNWTQLFVAKLGSVSLITDIPLVSTKNSEIKLYPNPSGGSFKISLENFSNAKLTICDALGKCVFRKECNGENEVSINLNNQPKGIYFIELLSDDARGVKKLLID